MKASKFLLVYVALIGGTIIFAWPFIWMAATSAKLERELFAEHAHVFPQSPRPQSKSPYIDNRLFADVRGPRMEEALAMIEAQLRSTSYVWPDDVDLTEMQRETARGVYARLLTTLPGEAWNKSSEELRGDITTAISPQVIVDLASRLRRVFCVGQLRVRSYDLQEEQLVAAENAASSWTIKGPATLRQTGSQAEFRSELHYDFSRGDVVALSQTFTTSFPISRLHRIQLYLRNDDTWHAINLLVEKNGALFRAERAMDDADINWVVDTWQERGPDDRPDKIRTWTLLREVERGPQFVNGANEIKIDIELSRRNFWQAWGAKILRNYRLTLDYIPFWRYVATSLFPDHSEFGRHIVQLLACGLRVRAAAMARSHDLFRLVAGDNDDSAAGHDDSAVPDFPKAGLVQHAEAALGDEFFRERVQCVFVAAISERRSARSGRCGTTRWLRFSAHLLAHHVATGEADACGHRHFHLSGDVERIHDAADLSERSTALSALVRTLRVPDSITPARHERRASACSWPVRF